MNKTNSNESIIFLKFAAAFLSFVFSDVRDIRVSTYRSRTARTCTNSRTSPPGGAELFQSK